MHPKKAEIYMTLEQMAEDNRAAQSRLSGEASLTEYRFLVRVEKQNGNDVCVWTDALQAALNENEIVRIPTADEPYFIDKSVLIPSNRRIEAEDGAVIKLMQGVKTLMFRNVHTENGTHAPISGKNRDCNIAICGGRWEESVTERLGYGRTGMYDIERSFFGVSSCMFFDNADGLTLSNMTFVHCGGFAVQMGDIKNVLIENITFSECFADGIHVNGNTEKIRISNVRGQVGDDLVALNMYDWQNSSVNFGSVKNVLCENLELSSDSRYKAMRIEPGIYYYDDGSFVDCSLCNAIIKNVRGINTFKLYYQTPVYKIFGGEPERGGVGSGDYIFFEDIEIDLNAPIDGFLPYRKSDPVRGAFSGFELGSNIEHMFFENIDIKLYPEKYPLSYLICAGPKSVVNGEYEVFDPYIKCEIGNISLKNICINGEIPNDVMPYILEIAFNNVNDDGRSDGFGKIRCVTYEKGDVKYGKSDIDL